MSSWTIYNIQGTPKYTVKDVEYHDTWMGEEYVMVKITSPTPLDLSIGDYLVYRGLTYSVYSVPGALKQARRNTYGEAFVYENIKLSARGTELTDIRFLDYVLNDNNIHYTSLPTFAFYAETVDDLLDRLQANTDREGVQWLFISPSYNRTMQRYEQGTPAYQEAAQLWEQYFGGSHEDPVYEKTNVNISIDKQSVWDGLAPIKNDFGLNFFSRERAVIVGGEGMPAEHVFHYGKGNGLYQIERVADQDQKVTTKLYAYGSDKNLPIRYYANITRICFAYLYARPSVDSNILYLDFVWNRSYVTGAADSDGKFPVVVSIAGVTYNVKAYPMDVGARTLFTIEASVSLGFVTRSMEIDFVSGIDKDKFPASNVRQESGALPNNMAVQVLMLPGFPQYSLADLCRCTYNGEQTVLEIRKTPSESYNEFMRIDGNHPITFSNDPLQPYILSGNVETIGIKEGDVHFVEDNDDNGLKEIYPSIEGMTRGDVEGTSSTERLDEIVSCDVIQDNGVFGEGVKIENFNLVLKDIGFDLKEAFDNAGGNMTLSMKDGYCGGRDFSVHSVTSIANGQWRLNVERSHDEGLDLWFPYSTNAAIGQTPTADEPYQIRTGDHFVLTEIEIGDTSYIWAASMKMLRKSITYLLNNDYTRFTYLPKVDEIYMARQHDESQTQAGIESLHNTLKSGMLMLFEDEDLDVDGSVFIDSLTIKENGNNGIPTYDVVLRNDKQVGTMQRIQNQINSITSYIGGGGNGGGGGLSVAQIRSLISSYGAGLFLSKLVDDTAQGVITFQQGLKAFMMSIFNGIKNTGRITSDEADIPLFVSDTTIQGNINVSGDANIGRQVDSRNVKTDGVQSHNYTGEGFADTGYRLTSDDGTGSSALTVDNLHVRKKATFEELEVKKETAIAGNQVYSCAANIITRTDYYNGSGDVIGYSKIRSPWLLKGLALVLGKRAANFKLFGRYKTVRVYLPDASQINYVRCYFLAKDGDREVENMWQAGKKDGVRWYNHGNDLARCQTMNLKNSNRKTYISNVGEYKLGNVYWWRKVINVSSEPVTIDGQEYHYFDVAMNDCDAGSDIPAAGDHVVQFGNDSDPDRMNLIVLEVNGSDAPAEKFYEGIHNYNLNDCYYGGHTMKARLSPKAGYKFQGSKFSFVTDYDVATVTIERGEWVEGTTYYYYDIVQHNGATWLCVASTGNVYTVVEDIKNDYTVIYPEGTTLNQTQYDALTVSQKMLCTRTATGSTTLEPTEANSSVWRYYAQQGTSPYFADIDNEMDSVVCDKDGKTTAAYSTTFRVYLWHGSTEMTLSDITISGTTTDITATKNVTNKTVTVSVAKGKTIPLATELTITPKATGAPNDQSVHFVLNGVRPGADGKPAVLYSIIPSISSIKCDKSNTLTPTWFTCTVQKVSGDSVSTATSTDGTLRYSIDNDITTSTQGTALTIGDTINSYTSSNKYIVLAFFEGTTLRDKERILIVADGSDGNGIVSSTRTFAISNIGTTASETTEPPHQGSWTASSPAVTEEYPYLWAKEVVVFTDTTKNTTKYYCIGGRGDNGVDAQDVEWVYIRTKTNTAPTILNDDTYTDTNGKTYTSDDHLPRVSGNTYIENNQNRYQCTDDPKGVTDEWLYEWEIKRTKGAASNGHRSWDYYQGTMTLHNNFAQSAFIIDLDNDNDQFGTDSNSKVLVTQTRSTTVAVYDGATQQTLNSLDAVLTYEDGTPVPTTGENAVATKTANKTTGVVSVTVLQSNTAFSHEAINATITAEVTGKGTKKAVFTIRKVMSGQPGITPIIYQLAPTQPTFSFSRDASNNLTPTSRTSQINVAKTEGNTTTILSTAQSGITYKWGFDDSATATESNKAIGTSISVTNSNASSHYQVWVELSTGDRETLPIVKDGAKGSQGDKGDKGDKGDNGKDGWMITANPANVIITQSLGTDTTSFSTQAVTFSAKKGNNDATVTSVLINNTTDSKTKWYRFKGSVSGTTVTVSSPQPSGDSYYTEGYFTARVTVTDPDSNNPILFYITVPCYANLLGTWKESVENGVKTVVAEEVDYDYLDGVLTKNGRSYTQTATAAGNYETWSTQADTVNGSKANMIKKTTTAQQTADGVSTKVSAITSEVGGQTVLKESQVTQYADEITASVTDGLTDTGIDIVNHTITAKADNFVIKNNSDQTTIQVDSLGNLTTTGNASFSGKISATSGDIGGFSIGTNKINSSNNKIILNDDGTATIGGFSVTSTKTSFTGEITSTSGTIGGFSIGTKDLTNTAYDASIVIQNAASNPTQIARIGKSAVDSMTNQSCSLQAESKGTGTYNTALYLDASSTNSNTYNYAFHGNGNGVLNGLVFGFKTQYVTIPSGSSDSLAYIKLQSGATIALKGSHSKGHVVMAAPNIDDVRQCLGLSTSDTTTPFAIEITVINISSYEHVHVGFRGDTASGTTLGTKYPWLMNYNNIPWPSRYRIQVAQGDILKLMLIYAPSSQGTSSYEYRAYQLLYLS